MVVLGFIVFVTMAAISILHFYWAAGGLWPAKNAADLVKTVAGAPDISRMPPWWLTFTVAVLIFIGGCMPLMQIYGVTPWFFPMFSGIGLWVLCAVFLLRGLVTYLYPPSFSNSTQPFKRLNILYFSPLCLILGLAYFVLAIWI